MALRLTAITDVDRAVPTEPPRPAPEGGPAALASLLARAGGALSAGDVAGWRAVFGEAGTGTGDVHLRHHARKLMAQTALGTTGTPARLGPVYAAVADALLGVLEDEPREPVLLNLVGVAFYELGAIAAAEPLFAAALRLDPGLTHAAGNLAECRRRRRAGLSTPPRAVGAAVL
ncbi:MAG: glycosyltransferase, partial [Solirubrobacterales bacterium]|nr:glycosyltransferase [Solirubrobacterales bacterium]